MTLFRSPTVHDRLTYVSSDIQDKSHTSLQRTKLLFVTNPQVKDVHKRALFVSFDALLLLWNYRSVPRPDSVFNHHSDDVHGVSTEILNVAKTANLLLLST